MIGRHLPRVAMTAALLTAAGAAIAGQARDPWQERQAATLTQLVERHTGAVPQPCGIAWLTTPFVYPEQEIAEGLKCILRARTQGRASWALWQFQGIDSTVFGGLATTPKGEVQVLHYDSYGGREQLDVTPCVNPKLSNGPGVGIGCDTP